MGIMPGRQGGRRAEPLAQQPETAADVPAELDRYDPYSVLDQQATEDMCAAFAARRKRDIDARLRRGPQPVRGYAVLTDTDGEADRRAGTRTAQESRTGSAARDTAA